jgi:uncharacterized protein YbjT (DUF2867 family)
VLPLQFAKAVHCCGARTLALVTPIGASVESRFFYARTKDELERDVQAIGFQSLTIVRPSIIGGQRNERRLGESIALHISKVLGPILPKKLREQRPVSMVDFLNARFMVRPRSRNLDIAGPLAAIPASRHS